MKIETPGMLTDEVKDWLDTFDGNDATVILAAIVNNELNTEEMINSILAFAEGETGQAEFWYQQMWRKEQ